MVLYRRTRKHDTILGIKLHSNATRLCTTILDDVRLVKACHLPLLLEYVVLNGEEKTVSRNNNITRSSLVYDFLA